MVFCADLHQYRFVANHIIKYRLAQSQVCQNLNNFMLSVAAGIISHSHYKTKISPKSSIPNQNNFKTRPTDKILGLVILFKAAKSLYLAPSPSCFLAIFHKVSPF